MFQIPGKSVTKGNDEKKADAAGTGERAERIGYILLCLGLLAFTANQFSKRILVPVTGWDYQTYTSTLQAQSHGLSPYVYENLLRYQTSAPHLAFDYPPHTLYFLQALDLILVFHSITIYYALLAILLLISGYLIVTTDTRPGYLFLLVLLLTAFGSTFWNFLTGNTGIMFLFSFSVIFALLAREKYLLSSIVMGISASVSLFTAPFILLYLAVGRPVLDRLVLIATSLGIVASLFVVSYITKPEYLQSYIGMMTGNGSPFLDGGGWYAPTPYLLFRDTLDGIASGNPAPWVLVSCGYIGLVLYGTWRFCRNNPGDSLKILSVVMLAIFMVLPRLKPYNFIILVVPLYFLFKDCSYRIKILVLAVISLLPYLVWSYKYLTRNIEAVPFPAGYVQACSLLLVFLVLILHDHLTHVADAGGTCGETTAG